MKVYWSKTAVLGFMFFTISLILVLSLKIVSATHLLASI